MNEKYLLIICIIGFVILLNVGLFGSLKRNSGSNMISNIFNIAKNPWQKEQEQLDKLSKSVENFKEDKQHSK